MNHQQFSVAFRVLCLAALCGALLLFSGIGYLGQAPQLYAFAASRGTTITPTTTMPTSSPTVTRTTTATASPSPTASPTATQSPTSTPTKVSTPQATPTHQSSASGSQQQTTPTPTKVASSNAQPTRRSTTSQANTSSATTAGNGANRLPPTTPNTASPQSTPDDTTGVVASITSAVIPQSQSGSNGNQRAMIFSLGGASTLTITGAIAFVALSMRRRRKYDDATRVLSTSMDAIDMATTNVAPMSPGMTPPAFATVDALGEDMSTAVMYEKTYALPDDGIGAQQHYDEHIIEAFTQINEGVGAAVRNDPYATTPVISLTTGNLPAVRDNAAPGVVGQNTVPEEFSVQPQPVQPQDSFLQAMLHQAQMGIFASPSSGDGDDDSGHEQ